MIERRSSDRRHGDRTRGQYLMRVSVLLLILNLAGLGAQQVQLHWLDGDISAAHNAARASRAAAEKASDDLAAAIAKSRDPDAIRPFLQAAAETHLILCALIPEHPTC